VGVVLSQEQKENSRRGVALLIAWRADLKMELLHGVYLGMAAFIHRAIDRHSSFVFNFMPINVADLFLNLQDLLLSSSRNSKKNLDFYCFVTSLCFSIFEKRCKCAFEK
jgi:hypothetical protein